jgi:hypothetical protein
MPTESITEIDELLDEEPQDYAGYRAAPPPSALEPPPQFRAKTPPPQPAAPRSMGRMNMSSEDELFEAVLGQPRSEPPVNASMGLFASQPRADASRRAGPLPPLNPVPQPRSAPLQPLPPLSPFGPSSGPGAAAPQSSPTSPPSTAPSPPLGALPPVPIPTASPSSPPAPMLARAERPERAVTEPPRRKGLGVMGALLLAVVSAAGGAVATTQADAWLSPLLARLPAPVRRFVPVAVPSPAALTAAPAAPKPPSSARALPEAGPTAAVTLVERAAQGEEGAFGELEKRPAGKLTVDEALALLRGREVRERKRVAELRRRAESDPAASQDATLIDTLRAASSDARTAPDALAGLAALPGPIGPDLLYEVWTGTPKRTDLTQVAESLVLSDSIRQKAAPALAVALDLRRIEECSAARDALPRVIEHGDRRSLHLLARFVRRTGCGDTKRQDCWACLRGDTLLMDAIKAANKRPEPRYGAEAAAPTPTRAPARKSRAIAPATTKKAPIKKAR